MAQKDFWQVRDDALKYLGAEHSSQLTMLEAIFDEIDKCVDVFEKYSNQDTYARICGLTLLKAKNLALGSCSLILDGLGQEAGALLRPFIEYTELLTYFRKFPEKAVLAPDGDLPRAGDRAKAIGGSYKEFREHLNKHASHSSYSYYSLAHLVESDKKRFRKLQRMVPHVLDKNFRDLAIQVYLLLYEGVLSLEMVDEEAFQSLGSATDQLHARLIQDFKIKAP